MRTVERLAAVTLALVLALAAAGCQNNDDDTASASPSASASPKSSVAPAPRSIALVRADQVQVRAGNQPLRSVAPVTSGATVRQLIWSADAKQLAWLETPEGEAGDSLVLADVATGATHRWNCTCLGIAFRGSDLVSDGADNPQQLLVYPAAGGTPSSWSITGLPAAADPAASPPQSVLDLVAGGKNGLFIGYANGGQSAYGGPQTVYRLDADGRATALYADPANGIPRDGVVSADGKQLAYRVNYRAGACENFDSVTLVDLATGKATSPELPGAAGKETALSTWFDATGQAWAALVPGPADCTRGTQVPARQVTPQVYREVTGKWVVTTQKALRGADLGSGRTLWFNATVPVDGQQVGALQPGTLTVEAGGAQPEQIADQVLTFAVAP